MKMLPHLVACGLLLARVAGATDVPLGAPAAKFGPANLDVIVAGAGLATQPATFAVDVPADGTIVAAYLYVNGRGAGDASVLVNGMAEELELVAASGPLPFDAAQTIETRRLDLTGTLGTGPTTFTVDAYAQVEAGGAFVVVVVSRAAAPLQTVTLLEGADYAYYGFDPPFGPDTAVGAFTFAPRSGSRTGRLFLFTHDTEATRADALWTLAAASAGTPVPASLVGGAAGATLLEIDRLGVPASAGGFAVGAGFDVVASDVAVPAGADYLAFQAESPADGHGDSLGLSVAVLALPDAGVDGPEGGPATCGNRAVEDGEACDDGNLADGDGCTATCVVETPAKTVDAIVRVRKRRRERLWYWTQLPDLPSDAVGTTPVHVTLVANGLALLDFEVPAKAFQRLEARETNAVPTGRFVSTRGRLADIRLQYLRLWPMQQRPTYNLKLKLRREMLRRSGGITQLQSIIRIGDRVFSSTDRMTVRRRGRILRNIVQ